MEKKKRKTKKYLIIGIILLILVGGYFYLKNTAQKAIGEIAKSYIVETEVEKGNVEVKLTGSGVLSPIKRQEIYAAVSGTVTRDYYDLNEKVEEGDSLFVIGGYSVRANIDGTLITKNVEEDDYVMTSSSVPNPVAVVADISKMTTILKVDELDIAKIKLGMKAKVKCEATGDKTYEGKVTKIASEGDSLNGVTTYDVKIEISKPKDLKIGMNVDIELVVESKENVLRVPMDAINKDGNESYVYVKDENVDTSKTATSSLSIPTSMSEVVGYKKQVVKTGINNKDYMEITSGLNEADKVYSISSSKSLAEYMINSSGGGMMSMGQ